MNREKPLRKRKGGRIPVDDPAVYRYSVRFNSASHAQFLSLYEQSGAKNKADFIVSRVFDRPFIVTKVDKSIKDYYMRLTTLFGQFRAIGNNYNQVVKALHSNFTEKKALTFLYKLEKATMELVEIHKQVIELTKELETKYLSNGSEY